jgi:hypothetical protein
MGQAGSYTGPISGQTQEGPPFLRVKQESKLDVWD